MKQPTKRKYAIPKPVAESTGLAKRHNPILIKSIEDIKDKETREYLEGSIISRGNDVEAEVGKLQLNRHVSNGNPRIAHYNGPDRSHFTYSQNKMYLTRPEAYLDELSHAQQQKDGKTGPSVSNTIDRLKQASDNMFGTDWYDRTEYNRKGSLEYDAHKIIEPKLRKEDAGMRKQAVHNIKALNELVPKYAWGGMPITAGQAGNGLQLGAQAVNMFDGYDGRPSAGGSIASGALSGASMGASFGPWGAAAGAVVGGGAALIMSEQNKAAEEKAQRQHWEAQTELDKANSKQTLRNYATQGITSAGSYAYGGQPMQPYEVEGQEVVQGDAMLESSSQLASDVQKVEGPSHAQGGVQGVGGEKIYSARLKSSTGRTYAKEAEYLGKQKGRYEGKLEENSGAARNTGTRMLEIIDSKLDNLFNEQEMKKYAKQTSSFSSSFAYGGDPGKPLFTNKVNKRGQYGGASEWASAANNVLPEGHVDNPYPYQVRKSSEGSYFFDPKAVDAIQPRGFAAPTSTMGEIQGVAPFVNPMRAENPAAFKRQPKEDNFSFGDVFNGRPHKNRTRVEGLGGRNRLQAKFAWGGDPTLPKGSAIQPLPQGWFIDPRSGRPANWQNNANGEYAGSEAGDAFRGGNFLLPGVGGNTYKNPVYKADDGSMYNTTVDEILSRPLSSRNVGVNAPSLGTAGKMNLATRELPVSAGASGATGSNTPNYAGAGFFGQYLDNLANGIATANTPQIAKPYMDPNVQLNTTYDINPQLQEARNLNRAVTKGIDQNTAQAGSANANKQNMYANSMNNSNQLYAQKFNIENDLQNKETLINSRINQGNGDKMYQYDVANTQRRAGIQQDYAANLSNVGVDLYTSARDNKMDARDVEVAKTIATAAPNSDTYFSSLDMFKRIYASDPARAQQLYNDIAKQSPNSPALANMAAILKGGK